MKNIYLILTCLAVAGCSREQPPPRESEPSRDTRPAASPKTPDDRPVIVAFGDSLSAGFGADPGQSFPDFVQKELNQRGYRYRMVNAGISGDTTTDGLERIRTITALQPVLVILEFGGNDGLRGLPVTTTRANLEQMILALQQAGAKVILAGMTLPPNYGVEYIRSFEGVYQGLARQYHLPLIPFLLRGVGGNPALMQRDGIHPTGEGNRVVAKNVMQVLEPLLSRKGG
ncbi:MAG TPA: arylesterase [Bryobacteraceae bacterium]|nr:arylesterase [Bryobacteraceae bacterium]HXJ41362.1 arylesterase [Bryobacteraceae bacterium]